MHIIFRIRIKCQQKKLIVKLVNHIKLSINKTKKLEIIQIKVIKIKLKKNTTNYLTKIKK